MKTVEKETEKKQEMMMEKRETEEDHRYRQQQQQKGSRRERERVDTCGRKEGGRKSPPCRSAETLGSSAEGCSGIFGAGC